MITYVDKSTAIAYRARFEKATQALVEAEAKEPGTGLTFTEAEDGSRVAENPISTIEQYFAALPKLLKLGTNDVHSEGRRYAMLPIGEDYFEIDANKRIITIPKAFSDNGIAVQGDQLAEVLYFKVDRYFDAKDLDDTDIYIQWINAEGIQGVSTPFVVDIMSEPNKMIFGWAIPNSVTKTQGQIQFAVRFYKWTDDTSKTTFSFSLATQTATVKVNPTLDFAIDIDNIEKLINTQADNELLINRIKTSKTTLTGQAQAGEPYYILDLTDVYDPNIKKHEDAYYVDLDENGEYKLLVQANSPDAGVITYDWSRVDLHDAKNNSQIDNVFEFIPTKDTTPQNKVYYIEDKDKSTDINKSYSIYDSTTGFPDDETVVVYEKIATCVAKSTGIYYATAANNVGNQNSTYTPSTQCIVPSPKVPIVGSLAEHVYVTEETPGVLTIEVDNQEENGTKNGLLTYVWSVNHHSPYAEDDGIADEFVELDAEDSRLSTDGKTLTINYAGLEDDAVKDVEGTYRVKVINTKNGESTIGVTEENAITECQVSYPAEAPVLVEPVVDENGRVSIDLSKHEAMTVSVDEAWSKRWNVKGNITYQWYLSSQDGDIEYEGITGIYEAAASELKTLKRQIEDGEVTLEKSDDILITDATESTFVPPTGGMYYCVVSNAKNDTSAESVSKIFVVAG